MRRAGGLLAGLMLLLASGAAVQPAHAAALVSSSISPTDGGVTGGCSTAADILTAGACEVATSGVDAAANGASSAASGVVGSAFESFAKSLAQGATDLATELTGYISASTTISPADLTRDSRSLVGVGTGLMMTLFLIGLISGVVRQDPAPLVQAVTGVFKFAVGGAAVAAVSLTLLTFVDQISDGLITQTGTSVHDTIGSATKYQVGDTTSTVAGVQTLSPGLAAFVAIMGLIALAILYGTLVIRKVLVITTVAFGPLAFAGLTWRSTAVWTRRYIETLVALIVSKFVVFFVFALGADLVTSSTSFSTILGGIVLLFLAAFSPLGTYKLLHFAEVQAAAALKQGLTSDVRRGVGGAAGGVQTATARASSMLGSARTQIPSVLGGPSGRAAGGAGVAAGRGAAAAGGGGGAVAGAAVAAPVVAASLVKRGATATAGAPGGALTATAPSAGTGTGTGTRTGASANPAGRPSPPAAPAPAVRPNGPAGPPPPAAANPVPSQPWKFVAPPPVPA